MCIRDRSGGERVVVDRATAGRGVELVDIERREVELIARLPYTRLAFGPERIEGRVVTKGDGVESVPQIAEIPQIAEVAQVPERFPQCAKDGSENGFEDDGLEIHGDSRVTVERRPGPDALGRLCDGRIFEDARVQLVERSVEVLHRLELIPEAFHRLGDDGEVVPNICGRGFAQLTDRVIEADEHVGE